MTTTSICSRPTGPAPRGGPTGMTGASRSSSTWARRSTHFHTSWWDQFHHAVDSGNGRVIDGKHTIVTALWGLDLQHEGQSELHPAFAMAMLVNDDPHDDRWAMFVRTWGDEGWCSGQLYSAAPPRAPNGWKVYKFRLPWRPGATGVTWDNGDFLGRTDWSMDVTPDVNDGVYVTFSFFQGTGDQAPRINGTLRPSMVWGAGRLPRPKCRRRRQCATCNRRETPLGVRANPREEG